MTEATKWTAPLTSRDKGTIAGTCVIVPAVLCITDGSTEGMAVGLMMLAILIVFGSLYGVLRDNSDGNDPRSLLILGTCIVAGSLIVLITELYRMADAIGPMLYG